MNSDGLQNYYILILDYRAEALDVQDTTLLMVSDVCHTH